LASSPCGGSPGVTHVTIAEAQAGQRIDNFLLARLKGVPKSRVYRILRKGEVRVNRRRVAPGYRLRSGDIVRVPPVRVAEKAAGSGLGAETGRALLASAIHDDGRLLVIAKPPGLAVHGGSGMSYGVIEALRAAEPDAPYLELVHRLDRETSGCLLIARRRSTLRRLHQLLRDGGMEKRYLAVVRGRWSAGALVQEDELVIGRGADGERHVEVGDNGKRAVTEFRPLTIGPRASLLEVIIHTGRTHQIRVQAAALGHPLAGDPRYGDPGFNREMRAFGLQRLFLHAAAIGYEDPATGEPRSFSAPLPEDLRAVLGALEADGG
jgi:23S rRNA pseudouridine955/2504/2580 synthase